MHKRVRALRQAYAEQLPHRITQIEGAWTSLRQEWDERSFQSLRMMAHSLAGSGAIFGFSKLSRQARQLEAFLKSIELPTGATPSEQETITAYLDSLRDSCLSIEPEEEALTAAEEVDDSPFEQEKSKRLIFLVSRNSDLAAQLSFQLGCFGYLVRTFLECREVLERLDEAPPAAVMVDAEPFEALVSEAKRTARALRRRGMPVPLLLMTTRSDLQSRLEAVRAGVEAYFTTPPDVRKLVEKLEILTHSKASDPYRILVVHSEYQEALSCSLTLQRAGMIAALATHPEQALKELVDFAPDLILMQVAMPEVSGPELAAIIRQTDAYVHVPIVFLAQETSFERQLDVMRSGADDLLKEPIELDHLISAVSYHVQRSRVLRYFMAHDSLTGLLNHTEVMERLETDFTTSQRLDRPMAYAILDIDQLRSINERFGYLSGDGVIKSLTRLLTQRLRRSDVIGRYAGEEFAIILPDTSGKQAHRVLGEIRALYAEIPHQSVDGSFYATFSCGVASLPGYELAINLHEDARRALQSAVRQGRNRVVLADE